MTQEALSNSSHQKIKEVAPHNGIIVIKVDFDRTLAEAKYPHGILNRIGNGPFNILCKPIDGAIDGLSFLTEQEGIVFGGISTARVKYAQFYTRRQILSHFGNLDIIYTSRSTRRKIVDVLQFAQMQNETASVSRTVLIDDDVTKIRKATHELAQTEYYRNLMKKYGFTFVAFNPEQNVDPTSFPDCMRDAMELQNWSRDSVARLLDRLRS